jgi:transcription initiation factor TFIIH subunit 3
MGQQLSADSKLNISIVCAFPAKSETVLCGDWPCIAQLRKALVDRSFAGDFETPVGQALSRALCFVNKDRAVGCVIIFDCSSHATDFASQSVAISNCGWAAVGQDHPLARINVVSLASDTPSAALLAVSAKTGGIHIPRLYTETQGSLLQAMLFHLTNSEEMNRILKTRPQPTTTHMGTVCACHNKSIDRGYVCSICLSIYCSDAAGICSACGSRIRREAKDEQPISAQVFEKLFEAGTSLFG